MARGWESKSVEEQQSTLGDRRAIRSPILSRTDAERAAILLQQKRIRCLIALSKNPRYVSQQQEALAFLEEKLRTFG